MRHSREVKWAWTMRVHRQVGAVHSITSLDNWNLYIFCVQATFSDAIKGRKFKKQLNFMTLHFLSAGQKHQKGVRFSPSYKLYVCQNFKRLGHVYNYVLRCGFKGADCLVWYVNKELWWWILMPPTSFQFQINDCLLNFYFRVRSIRLNPFVRSLIHTCSCNRLY